MSKINRTEDFFKNNDRFNDRHAHRSKEEKERIWAFRALIWKAIDEDDKDFSIVETAIALGLHERKP
jgi:hypothetical protein